MKIGLHTLIELNAGQAFEPSADCQRGQMIGRKI
jgi:hypothetical protein